MIAQTLDRDSIATDDGFVVPVRWGRSISPAVGAAVSRDDFREQSPVVYVVDPDPVTATTVKDLLQGYDLTVQAYASGREFFAAYAGGRPGCLVLEQRIFDISGFQIQRRLAAEVSGCPWFM